MQLTPAIKSLESVIPYQAEPNVSEAQEAGPSLDGFDTILAKELNAEKTNPTEESDAGQAALSGLGFVTSENDAGLKWDHMLSNMVGVEPDSSGKIDQPGSLTAIVRSLPDNELHGGLALEVHSESVRVIDMASHAGSDQKMSVETMIVEIPGNLIMSKSSEYPEVGLNLEKGINIEGTQLKGFDQPVFQKISDLSKESVADVYRGRADVLQETDSTEVKGRPTVIPGDMGDQLVEESASNLKPVLKNEGNENRASLSKESFEKIFQSENGSRTTSALLSNRENPHTGKDLDSFLSDKGLSLSYSQKTIFQDSKVDFAHVTTLHSSESNQAMMETVAGNTVDLSSEVDTVSVKEVKPQTVSRTVQDQLMDQVSNSVRFTVKQGGGEVRMRLYPDSLGELKIELSVEDGLMKAKFLVNNSVVKDVIEDNFHRLRDSLMNNGLKVESFSVSVDHQDKGSDLENPLFSQFDSTPSADTEALVIEQHEELSEHRNTPSINNVINIFT